VEAGPAPKTGPSKGRKGGEEASGTRVLSLKGVQRLRYRAESQAPDTGISPIQISHPSVLVNLKQLRWTLWALSPRPPQQAT